jgi:hypothetical protein
MYYILFEDFLCSDVGVDFCFVWRYSMRQGTTAKVDHSIQFNKISAKISNLLRAAGPLSLQDIQKLTQDSYFTISTAVGLMYQNEDIIIQSTGRNVVISLA